MFAMKSSVIHQACTGMTREYAPKYTSEEWERMKPKIQQLYLQKEKKLLQVIRILNEEHGFTASERQLKRRISEWGLDKYVKGEIMIQIAWVELKRKILEGKESSFRINKKPVPKRKITRYLKRNKISEKDLISMASPIDAPSPVFSVFTPCPGSPSDIGLQAAHSMQGPTTPPDQSVELVVSSDLRHPDEGFISKDPSSRKYQQSAQCAGDYYSGLTVSRNKRQTLREGPFLDRLPRYIPNRSNSTEILLLRFREQICPLLSITDGPSNLWQTLVLPLVRDSQCLRESICAVTALHLSTENSLRLHGIKLMGQTFTTLNCELQGQTASLTTLATILILAFWTRWDEGLNMGKVHIMGAMAFLLAVLSRYRKAVLGLSPSSHSLFAFLYDTCSRMDSLSRLVRSAIVTDQYGTLSLPAFDYVNQEHSVPGLDEVPQIDPWMGYARNLYPLIRRAADLCYQVRTTNSNSIAIIIEAVSLKREIEAWSPEKNILLRANDSLMNLEHRKHTAEAYRYATILYLHQVVPTIRGTSIKELLRAIFFHLSSVPSDSRVTVVQIYPLFVAGCEASSDEERRWAKERWMAMVTRINVKNVYKCWEITQEVWRRRDTYRQIRSESSLSHQEQPGFDMRDMAEDIDPESTVRERLRWASVMKDRDWEVSF